jgi:hypothetical protein
MALVLRFGFAAQVIAAFVIFVLGYVGLFVALMLLVLVVRGLYESAKWIHASALRRANTNAGVFDRRIPLTINSPASAPQLAEITFHPALNRRRVSVAANYSSNLRGGTPR